MLILKQGIVRKKDLVHDLYVLFKDVDKDINNQNEEVIKKGHRTILDMWISDIQEMNLTVKESVKAVLKKIENNNLNYIESKSVVKYDRSFPKCATCSISLIKK